VQDDLRGVRCTLTSNELAARFRKRIKLVDQTENRRRLDKHVLPVVFRGRKIADTPLDEFTLDHADHVLAQPTLPEGSLRHVAQCMARVLKLAVYPTRVLDRSPFPPGWLPPANKTKERSYLFPQEEAKLLAFEECPLVRRLFFGFLAREGMRRENAVTVEWSNLTLDLPQGEALIVLDMTKNGRGGSWRLDPGTAEALRRWRRICPSDRLVFPTEALPRHRRSRAGQPLVADHGAADLRAALKAAHVDRPKLYEHGGNRLRLRLHDLRATFVTLALAKGETEDWVVRRTGHLSSAMVARYRRDAETAEELNLGWLLPMHEAIPELQALGPGERPKPTLVVVPGPRDEAPLVKTSG
jgi:integrase